MRILIASDSFPPKIDGVADTSAIVARKLVARGHFVRVVAPAPGPDRGDGFRVIRLRSVPLPIYPEFRIALGLDRVARLARRRWDGAIVLTPGPIGATTLAFLPKSTTTLNVYTTDIPDYLKTYSLNRLAGPTEQTMKALARRAHRTLCPTKHVESDLRKRGYARTEVWGRGVDTELFNPGRRSDAMRERLAGCRPDMPIALYVGRLAREKRVEELRDVIPALPGVRFAFVGDGPERTNLEALFTGLPVVFTGYLRGEELATAFASADFFVFPSASETFGQVAVQAMASGLVPLVAKGSATAELVPEGSCGIHIDPGCPEQIVDALQDLLNDRARTDSMARASVAHAATYSWDSLVSRLEELLATPTQA